MSGVSIGVPPWMALPQTQAVIAALEAKGGAGCARFVGGCVRNALMGKPVDDVDIATTLTPDQIIEAIEQAGLRAVPTGVEHGTVTALSGGRPYEVTTLRRDVATDGRRAVVAFTLDWAEDAERRDFRFNALYADAEGRVYDPVGQGIEDARAHPRDDPWTVGLGLDDAIAVGVGQAQALGQRLGLPVVGRHGGEAQQGVGLEQLLGLDGDQGVEAG